ncbi:MAG: hypothetical protein K0S26_3141 [Bacteroidota bacterium]|jgi:hypothetical protein|nr:hypothetical protein [Bacteroidota bacterium]
MKKYLFFILFSSALINNLISQVDYKDVAGIFYARCTSCHHTGGSDYPFMNYTETAAMASSIDYALQNDIMPPWSADTSYTRFMHERIITSSEKQLILDWISGGTIKGDTTLAPPAPIIPHGYQLAGNADLTLSIGNFTSTSTSTDKYYCFSIPSGLTQDRILRAFEIVPGNPAIVHHAVVTADTTGAYTSDLSGSCYNIPGNLGIGTYAPGSKATIFPSQAPLKAGMYLKAGSKIIIQLHYPSGSAGEVDSTKIRLFFYPVNETGVRRIYSTTPLQNWSMSIPANTIKTFSAYYPSASISLPVSLSAFAVMPHSHLLCKSILYYAVNPGIDTIKLVRINDWDFEWQDYYTFKKLVKIPAGYKLYSKHVYDNTAANPNNPSSPPVNVYAGTGTMDEMLFDGMMYLIYQPGDELIDIETIINNDTLLNPNSVTAIRDKESGTALINSVAYPNPFTNTIAIKYILKRATDISIEIRDIVGRKVYSGKSVNQSEGYHELNWDGRDLSGNKASAGIYFYTIKTGDYSFDNKIIKQD